MSDNNLNSENNQKNVELDENNINLSFTLTRTDLFWYNIYFIRLLVVAAIICFIAAIGVFIYTLNLPLGDFRTMMYWVVMGFAAGFSISGGTIAAIVLQVFVLKNETIAKAMTLRNYLINSSGIAVFNEQGKITRTWKDIHRIIKTHHGYYIKTGDRIAIVLPRHVFRDDRQIEFFEQLIQYAKS